MPSTDEYADMLPRVPTSPRDLALANAFTNRPALWDFLLHGARFPVAFCACSDIVVSLIAILAGKWFSYANAREDGPLFSRRSFTLDSVRSVGESQQCVCPCVVGSVEVARVR